MSVQIVTLGELRFKRYSFRDKKEAKRFAGRLGSHLWEIVSVSRTKHNVIVRL